MRFRLPTTVDRLTVVALAGILITAHYLIFSRFFPGRYGTLGHDYEMFLPALLDGYYWFHANGLFAVPWFTPSFCGGVPKFPNPQALYFSVPQLLTFSVDPLTSVKLTLLVFAALGFGGAYLLVRRIVGAARPTAFLSATLFLFNGLYAHRMAIGHLTFHSFMLIPLLAYYVLRGAHAPGPRRRPSPLDIGLGALLLAYIAATGLAHVLFQALTILLLTALMCALLHRSTFRPGHFVATLMLTGLVAGALCAAQLVAIGAYLRHFPRDMYPLPGIPRIWDLLRVVLASLFWQPADETAAEVMTNSRWMLERHEFEFGLTPVPLVILIVSGLLNLYRFRSLRWWQDLRRDQWLYLAMIVALLALPLALNYYTPQWNALLKGVPILESSSSLFRWFSIYIPAVVLLVAIAVERTPALKRNAGWIAGISVPGILVLNIMTDRDFYHRQEYDPAPVLRAYGAVKANEWQPAITRLGAVVDARGRPVMSQNDLLARGESALLCYESIFGYRLEAFPRKTLHVGAVMEERDGRLNIKNPVCYVFPRENGCTPGDHFGVGERAAADAFTHFRPYPFRAGVWQRAANWGSALSLAVVSVLLTLGCPAWRTRLQGLLARTVRRRAPGSRHAGRG